MPSPRRRPLPGRARLPIAAGNGRLEAESIDIATKSGGRLLAVNVREGDMTSAGEEIGRIDTQTLQAQLRSAQAQSRQAQAAVATLASVVRQREQAVRTVEALAVQRTAEAALAERELRRTSELVAQNFISPQQLDAAESRVRASRAALEAVRSQRLEAEAAVVATRSQLAEAQAAIESARAAVERVQVEIADAVLRAPRAGRVQTVLAHAGEVLAPGGRVATLVDLSDVTMSFFLPERAAGRVAIGSEARLVLDAAPKAAACSTWSRPGEVDFVANARPERRSHDLLPAHGPPAASPSAEDAAGAGRRAAVRDPGEGVLRRWRVTPKTVETKSEREKLMFRVVAQIAPDLLRRHITQVKTGLPGMAYVRLDDSRDWPARLPRHP